MMWQGELTPSLCIQLCKKRGVFLKFCDVGALLGNLLIATRFTRMLNYLEITSFSTVVYSKDKGII